MRKLLLFVLLVSTPGFARSGNPSGWRTESNRPLFYYNNQPVLDPENKIEKIFANTSLNRFDLALLAGEYYHHNSDEKKLEELLQYLDTTSGADAKMARLIIEKVVNRQTDEENGQEDEKGIDKTEHIIFYNISKLILKEKEEKLPEGFKNINCNKNDYLYSYCRILKLKYYLDRLENPDQKKTPVDYINLNRILAPFFEEEKLTYISFLDEILPELPEKLAVIGLADAAVHFQENLIQANELSGLPDIQGGINVAYYNILNGNIPRAMETYRNLLGVINIEEEKSRNRLHLLLSSCYFLLDDYNKALGQILEINTSSWDNTIRNPFNNQFMNIQDVKDLAAVMLWHAKGSKKAAAALNMAGSDIASEKDQFLQLRMAQIISGDSPELAAKIAEDIIYSAQSRKWKNTEYLATIMRGFLQITLNNNFQAIIDFTKSNSINASSQSKSDWLRLAGMMTAYQKQGTRTPVSSIISEVMHLYENGIAPDKIYKITHYAPSTYNSNEILDMVADYYIQKKLSSELFLLLLTREKSSAMIKRQGIFQINAVIATAALLNGFGDTTETNKKLKESASIMQEWMNRSGHSAEFRIGLSNLKIPLTAVFELHGKIVLFHAEPGKKRTDLRHFIFTTRQEMVQSLDQILRNSIQKKMHIQIYYNPAGVDVFNALEGKTTRSMFSRFSHLNHRKKNEPITTLSPDCAGTIPFVTRVNTTTINGKKTTGYKDKMFILALPWKLDQNGEYILVCQNQIINLGSLVRRADFRTIPGAVFLLNRTDAAYQDYIRFWLDLGTDAVFSGTESNLSGSLLNHDFDEKITNPQILQKKAGIEKMLVIINGFF